MKIIGGDINEDLSIALLLYDDGMSHVGEVESNLQDGVVVYKWKDGGYWKCFMNHEAGVAHWMGLIAQGECHAS